MRFFKNIVKRSIKVSLNIKKIKFDQQLSWETQMFSL